MTSILNNRVSLDTLLIQFVQITTQSIRFGSFDNLSVHPSCLVRNRPIDYMTHTRHKNCWYFRIWIYMISVIINFYHNNKTRILNSVQLCLLIKHFTIFKLQRILMTAIHNLHRLQGFNHAKKHKAVDLTSPDFF